MVRDPRAEELNNLKMALATFALQLDAFEARLKGRLSDPNKAPLSTAPDIGFANKIVSAMKSADTTDRDPNSE